MKGTGPLPSLRARDWPSDTSSCRIKPASKFCCGIIRVYAVQAWLEEHSVYHPASNSIERAFTPLSCHGDHDAVKSWTLLTSIAEAALKEFVGKHAHFTT